jgi:hypothetical protein
MPDEAYTPEERRSSAPRKQRVARRNRVTTLQPEEADAAARRRTSAAKAYPVADAEEIERSRERGGPHSDAPPTDVAPPPPHD